MAGATMARMAIVFRHSAVVRVTHWVNVLCLVVLLMSGMQIYNAHAALYWGNDSHFEKPLFQLPARQTEDGEETRAIPYWLTLPGYHDLATGRRWHLFFAWVFVLNGAVYLTSGIVSGHFRRDLAPTRPQLRHIGSSFLEHLKLRFPKGEEAKQYNVLQKLAYLAVIFILLPVIVLAGFNMSPALNAAFPWLLDLFGGRQSARTIHFVAANFIVLFFLVHVAMVIVSGLWNNLRSMITGRYAIQEKRED